MIASQCKSVYPKGTSETQFTGDWRTHDNEKGGRRQPGVTHASPQQDLFCVYSSRPDRDGHGLLHEGNWAYG